MTRKQWEQVLGGFLYCAAGGMTARVLDGGSHWLPVLLSSSMIIAAARMLTEHGFKES